MKTRILFPLMVMLLTLTSVVKVNGQSYCIPTFVNVANYQCGIQNVTMGAINNTTGVPNGVAVYTDFSASMFAAFAPGATVNFSLTAGPSNGTSFGIYIDWNRNFQFEQTEKVFEALNVPNNNVRSGSFVVPGGQAPGSYRMRVTGDIGFVAVNNSCLLQYTGDVEDYGFIVLSPSLDVAATDATRSLNIGDNTIQITFSNLTAAQNITSVDIGYNLNNGTPVTQTVTGINMAPGTQLTRTFTTPLNISTPGNYVLKVWARNPNNAGAGLNTNDTIASNTRACYPLNGTYTINPSGSGGSNYTSINAAVSDLRLCGVNGPVVFQMASGTFTEQVSVPNIPGASSINTVQFRGAGRTATTLTFANQVDAARYTLQFNGSSFVTFRDLTIRSTNGSFGWTVHFFQNGVNANAVRNANIECLGVGTGTSTNGIPVLFSNSQTSYTTSITATNNIIDSCTLDGGWSNYVFYGNTSSNVNTGNFLSNSILRNAFQYGVYGYYWSEVKILYNNITMRTSGSFTTGAQGIYCLGGFTSVPFRHEIIGNYISNCGNQAINLNSMSGSVGMKAHLFNNYIGGNFTNTSAQQGIFLSSSQWWNIYHNSVNMNTNSATIYGIQVENIAGSFTTDVRNNAVQVTGTGANRFALYSAASTMFSDIDYNNLFVKNSSNVLFLGQPFTSANYKGAAFFNVNSFNLESPFQSVTNPRYANGCITGFPLAACQRDINNASRTLAPNVGALEFVNTATNDIGIVAISAPSGTVTPGLQNVVVRLKNFGSNTVTSAQVSYTHNNGTPVTVTWSGTLAACGEVDVTFSGANRINIVGGVNNITAYTRLPNNITDSDPANDAAQTRICPAMNGTFTINPSSNAAGNFKSFREAVDALVCSGLNGPVVFNVAAGTYVEQVELRGVAGVSATNTITFDGGTGNRASRILTFAATTSGMHHTFLIDNTSFVNLRNLTILGTGVSFGWPVHIMGNNVGNINIVNCVVGLNGNGFTSTSTNFIPINLSNSTTSVYSSFAFTNIVIDSCEVYGGWSGAWFYGNGTAVTGCRVLNSFFRDSYYALYFQSTNAVDVINNRLYGRGGNANTYGAYFSNVTATGSFQTRINNNDVRAGYAGLFLQSVNNNSSTRRGEINNNMIGGQFLSTGSWGIYMSSCTNWDMFHNSVNVDFLVTSTTAAALYTTSVSNLDMRNNIFALTHPSLNNSSIFPVFHNNAITGLVCNFNTYFKNGTTANFLRINGVLYTAANFIGGGGFNTNSYFANPMFVSNTDLHTNNGCRTGAPLTSVTTDFDGDARSTTAPSVGADEGRDLDAMIEIISPGGTTIGTLANFQVRLTNTGKTTINSSQIAFSVNGGAPLTQTGGSMSPCGEVLFNFNSVNIPASGLVSVASYIQAINGGLDQNRNNDTAARAYCNGALSGAYTVNPTSGAPRNFPNVATVMSVLNSCGMAGPVTLNFSAGVFEGQMLFSYGTIPGLISNQLTIQGVDSAASVISFMGGGFTVRLDGADNMVFRNIGFSNTGTASAFTMHLTNGADNNLFDRCSFYSPPISNTTVITFGIMGTFNTATGVNWGQNNTVQNSRLEGGYWTVNCYGSGSTTNYSQGNKFLNNHISGGINYTVYNHYQQASEYINNTILAPASASGVMYHTQCPTPIIERNYIYGGNQYGIFHNQAGPSTAFARGRVYNNFVGGQSNTSTPYGIYTINTNNVDFWHNSVYMANTSANGIAFYSSSGSSNSLRNNILVSDATTNGYAVFFNTQNTFTSVDWNNYQVLSSTFLARTWGTNHVDIATYRSSNTAFNQNSISVRPNWINFNALTPDMHLTDIVAAPSGDNNLGVMVDIDNDARCVSSKSIGADESKYVEPVSARFSAPDTVYIQSPFTAINADAPGANRSYQWDFNNDGSIEFTTLNATYMFTSGGMKQIKLRTLSCNGVDSFVRNVFVAIPTAEPQADFISDKYSVAPFELVTIQDLSTNGPTWWDWTITPNNGSVFYDPNAQNPEIFFGEPGVYTVCLISQNLIGSSPSKCKMAYITVRDVNNMCIGNVSSSAASGEIFDSGGPTGSYGNMENCTFLIEPCATSINLKFSQFAVANAAHFLRVYDGRDATGTLLGTYSNTSGLPGGTNGLTATSGAMFLTWQTNTVGSAQGFAARWTSVPNSNATLIADFDLPDTAYVQAGVDFINTSVGNGMNFDWDFDGDALVDANTTDGNFIYYTDGTYDVTLVVYDACGNMRVVTKSIVIVTPSNVPTVDFVADARIVTTNDIVKITDLSTNGPISWNYTITPTTFVNAGGTGRNPWYRFTDTGLYTITLDADNAAGTGTATKTAYIRVLEYCAAGVSDLVPDLGINKVLLSNMENVSSSGQAAFTSYFNDANVQPAQLDAGGTYELVVARNSTLNRMNRKAWIDYNGDGDFNDAGELIASESATTNATWAVNITIPVSALRGATRMRVGAAFADSTNVPCGTNFYGEVEEYRVVINDDITPPLITLLGISPESVDLGQSYTDAGATAHDAVDGNVTANIVVTNNLNVNVAGTYQYRYNVSDAAGNAAVEVVRQVIVNPDITPPVLQLASPTIIVVPLLSTWAEPGYTAIDAISGNVTANVVVDRSAFDSTKVGEYLIRYIAADAFGNTDTAYRTVFVIDNIAPVITLNGTNPIEVEVFTNFNDPGVSVTDNYDPIVIATISTNLNLNVLGSYTIQYEAKDAAGNVSNISRTVNVVDLTAPVLTVANLDTIVVEVFGTLALPGRSAQDNYDPNPTIVVGGGYNPSVLGTYTVTMYAQDGSGNQSATQSLVVRVVDTKAPVISLNGSYLTTVVRWSTFTDPGVTISDNYYTGLTATVGGNFVNTATEGIYYITYDVTDGSGNVAAQVTRAINVVAADELTGVGNVSAMGLNMFPNPANSVVNLSFAGTVTGDKEVRLITNLGQVIMSKVWNEGQNELSLDISAVMPGVYYVQVVHEGTITMEKLVVTK